MSYDWYVNTASEDTVLIGAQVSYALNGRGPHSITLVVTDDRGLTDFAGTVLVALAVMPGDAVSAINPASSGLTPVAVVSSADLDATTIAPSALRFGPRGAEVRRSSCEDVNGERVVDLVVHFKTIEADLLLGQERACLTGTFPDGVTFEGCDAVKIVSPVPRRR